MSLFPHTNIFSDLKHAWHALTDIPVEDIVLHPADYNEFTVAKQILRDHGWYLDAILSDLSDSYHLDPYRGHIAKHEVPGTVDVGQEELKHIQDQDQSQTHKIRHHHHPKEPQTDPKCPGEILKVMKSVFDTSKDDPAPHVTWTDRTVQHHDCCIQSLDGAFILNTPCVMHYALKYRDQFMEVLGEHDGKIGRRNRLEMLLRPNDLPLDSMCVTGNEDDVYGARFFGRWADPALRQIEPSRDMGVWYDLSRIS